jgi:hypothetical protein
VHVLVALSWHVVVKNHIYLFNVDSSAQDVSGYHHSVLTLLELIINLESCGGIHAAGTDDGWESLILDDFVELLGILDLFGEDDDLVEVQIVKQLDQLFGLLILLQLHEVLFQPVQHQFGVAVNEEFERVLHEFLANELGFVWEGGREHHHLFLGGGGNKDLLDLLSHVYSVR